MKIFNRILNILAFVSCLVLLYLFFPSVAQWIGSFKENGETKKLLIADHLDNLKSLKAVGSLVADKDVVKDFGNTGEQYEFDISYYPYYGMLNDNYKKLYKQIYANSLNMNDTFTPIIDINKNDITLVMEALLYDHPELFWLDNSYAYKYNTKGICLQLILKFNNTSNDIENNKRLFDREVNAILQESLNYDNLLEKEIFVHDRLVQNLNYDLSSDNNQSAYSALVNHYSVCAGYSKAFQYIMQKLGIPCYYVTGDSGGDHAWNIIKLDDYYYNVDLTWDNTGGNMYAYFNKNDKDFSLTHNRSAISASLPKCTGNSYVPVSKSKSTIKKSVDSTKDIQSIEKKNDDNYIIEENKDTSKKDNSILGEAE